MKEMAEQTSHNRVKALFSDALAPTPFHGFLRDRVSTIVRDFLAHQSVTAQLDDGLLAERFSSSDIPEAATDLHEYVDYLEEEVVPYSINMSSPTCLGHMTGGLPYFVWVLAELVTAMNQNLVKRDASKALTFLERQTLAMIHRLFYDFPQSFYDQHIQKENTTLGIMTGGGTLSNITALWIARNSSLGPLNGFAGVEEEGISAALKYYGYEDAVIIGSRLMHYSTEKSAGLLGFGVKNLLKISVNDKGQIDLAELRNTVKRCRSRNIRILALVGNAGTTDCGSIEPLSEMAEIAQEANAHFHVDAAWGGPLVFSERHRSKLRGIQSADSITVDAHKQIHVPIGSSMLLLREPLKARVIEKHTRYMLQEQSGDLGKRSLEGSRPAGALYVHAALHIVGQTGFEYIIDEKLRKARFMADLIRQHREFELLVDPEMNILLYRFIPRAFREAVDRGVITNDQNSFINEFNEQLQFAQSRAGRTFVSRTTLGKKYGNRELPVTALRAIIGNPNTTEYNITVVLEDQLKIAFNMEKTPFTLATQTSSYVEPSFTQFR